MVDGWMLGWWMVGRELQSGLSHIAEHLNHASFAWEGVRGLDTRLSLEMIKR